MIKCGIYESDITPALGMEMPGYFSVRKAGGIKERLYSEAVFFDNGTDKAVVISNDTILIPEDVAENARSAIALKLNMKKSCVLICATHSHTSGPVESWGDFVHLDTSYTDLLQSRLIDGAVMAASQARDVLLSFATGFEDKIAYYRNYLNKDGSVQTWGGTDSKPFGNIDSEVGVLRIDNSDGSPYGTIVNYACHCDCVGGTEFSSDYPGEMRKTLRLVYGDAFRPVFINGFCGNINHCDPAPDSFSSFPNHYKRMGRILAADVIRTRELATNIFTDERISGADCYISLPTREAEPDAIASAEAYLSQPNHEDDVVSNFYASETKRFQALGSEDIPLVLQVVKIGELAIYGMPGEIYVEFGMMLKENSPVKYNMPANLSNGCVGYIPIPELFKPGIYEARLCSSSKLVKNAGYIMKDKLLELADIIK